MRLIIAFVLALVTCPPALAQSKAAVDPEQTRILALETAWNRAEEQKDAKALDTLLASSLLYIDYDGTLMNKAQFLESVKAPSLHPEQIVNETVTAQMYGNIAIVSGVYREKGKSAGKAYLRRGRFIDTWINLNGTWQCVTSQSTLIGR
jgi:hypothetical protein